MKQWLLTMSILILVFSLFILSTFVGGWASPDFRSLNLAFWSALALFATGITMMQSPVLLYGMPRLNRMIMKKPLQEQTVPKEQPLALAKDYGPEKEVKEMKHGWEERYSAMIDDYRKTNVSFLKPKYTIKDMADDLGIPRHHLSYVLNKVYQQRSNDFINELRINYMCDMVRKDHILKEKTLEGLARDAGFASRITFIRAVQRITGENPSDYFRKKI
jgi:AraC-like DNA-binding protein